MGRGNKITRRDVLKTVGITGLAASSITAITSTVTAKRAEQHVPKGLAKKAAQTQVLAASQRPEFSEWRGASVGRPTMYKRKSAANGPTYLPSAYVFSVTTGTNSAGYVTVAARRDEGPILEYSKATPPNQLIDKAIRTGEKLGKTAAVTPLYHGGVKYGLAFDDGTAMNVRNGQVEHLSTGVSSSFLATDSKAATRQWGAIKETPTATVNSIASLTNSGKGTSPITSQGAADHIWGVPAWTEHDNGGNDRSLYVGPGDDTWAGWDGCTPIAGSMVIAWHEGIGEGDSYNREKIIDILHLSMKTNDDSGGSTVWYNVDGGFDEFDGYVDDSWRSYDGRNNYNWPKSLVRNEISHNRPIVLNMMSADSANDGTGPYGDHSVTIVGYCCNVSSLRIHDGLNDDDHYLNMGSWWQSMLTTVYPH